MRRACVIAALVLCTACGREPQPPAVRPGEPLPGLTDAELGRFLLGRAVFERIATPEEGLGPLFNADRCSACHDAPVPGGTGAALVVKATTFDGERCDLLEAAGGDNLQQRVTPALAALGIGPERPAAGALTTRVTAPPLFGLGLLEAVPDATLLEHADPDDADGDGISGRAPVLPDGRVARMGRKGETATIDDFVDTALRFELGLTTPANPHEERPEGHDLPESADPMAEPEIEVRGVELLSDFARYLAPPPRAIPPADADAVRRGEVVFADVGCASCHIPELRTGTAASPALSDRTVHAYTDLLLHDMGDELASVCGLRATPREWRTAPLWGLRLRERLLHDGRAADPAAAIEAHGGEATASRAAWRALDPTDRAALLAYLLSL